MKRLYSVLVVLAIIGVAVWIFFIITGDGPPEEVPSPVRSAGKLPSPLPSAKTNETNQSGSNESGGLDTKLTVVDLGFNISEESFNFPDSLLGSENVPSRTLTRLMYVGHGLWDVFGFNLFQESMPFFLREKLAFVQSGDPVSYFQKINFPSNVTLYNFSDVTYKGGNATIGFNLSAKESLLQYDISFTKSIPIENLTGEMFDILGKQFYVREALASAGKLHLLQSPYIFDISTKESFLVNYPSAQSTLISIELLEDESIFLKVDDTTTSRLRAGDEYVYGNVTIAIDEILFDSKSVSKARLAISPRNVVFENGKWLVIDKVPFEGLRFNFYPDGQTTIDGFTIDWEPREKTFVTFNESITLPYFETIQISMSDWEYFDTELDTDPYVYLYITTRSSRLLELNNSFGS